MLLVHQNTGKENRYGKNFFAVLISTLGRFDRANKEKSVMYTLNLSWKGPKTLKLYQDIVFFPMGSYIVQAPSINFTSNLMKQNIK